MQVVLHEKSSKKIQIQFRQKDLEPIQILKCAFVFKTNNEIVSELRLHFTIYDFELDTGKMLPKGLFINFEQNILKDFDPNLSCA
jgi:hypothetical protein